MPEPGENEKEDDFIERCIPVVIKDGTAKDGSQANAICHSIWEESKKKKTSSKGELKMRWYEIKAQADNSEIWLYDEIGLYGVGSKEFISELNAIKSPKINMHINSPGGEVFEGAAICTAMKRHPSMITTYIDGIAASIASVIALSGKKVIMAENSFFMLHNPSGLVIGPAEDMRKTADTLDKIRDSMVRAYMDKTGRSETQIRTWLDSETWMTAEEAKEAGFCDEISDRMDMAACARFIPVMTKMKFKNIPEQFLTKKKIPTKRETESILIDNGYSQEQAKRFIAGGYSECQRDADAQSDTSSSGTVQSQRDAEVAVQRDAEQPKPAEENKEAKVISEEKHKTLIILNDERFLSV